MAVDIPIFKHIRVCKIFSNIIMVMGNELCVSTDFHATFPLYISVNKSAYEVYIQMQILIRSDFAIMKLYFTITLHSKLSVMSTFSIDYFEIKQVHLFCVDAACGNSSNSLDRKKK